MEIILDCHNQKIGPSNFEQKLFLCFIKMSLKHKITNVLQSGWTRRSGGGYLEIS